MENKYTEAASVISSLGVCDTAVILGSGLGGLTARLGSPSSVPYADIPGFPVSTAPGHAGRLFCGKLGGKNIYCLSGRSHYYEGRDSSEITFPVRALRTAGVKNLIVTNAAGGINTSFSAGELMLITDHINFLKNPLIGENDSSFGERFPDMTYAYDPELRRVAREAASAQSLTLREGVYIAVTGPSYETPAEIRAFRTLGADAVGMSTVPEVITAAHCGMRVLGISLITNMAAGVLDRKLTGEEVVEAAGKAAPVFESFVAEIISRL